MTSVDAILDNLESYEEYGTTDYKPLTDAVDEFVEFCQNPQNRVLTGVPELDAAMRGIAPGEFCVVLGYAHQGKTLLVVETLIQNQHHPVLMFSPDETRVLVLQKLAAALDGISVEELERRIERGDAEAIDSLQQVAEQFELLAVYEEQVSIHRMEQAYHATTKAIGKPRLVVFDYAQLLSSDEDVDAKLTALKMWGKKHNVAMVVVHQSNRGSGGLGQEITMESAAFGGDRQATFMIGVRRKIEMFKAQARRLEEKIQNTSNQKQAERYQEQIDDIYRIMIPRHRDTITVSLVKNKRPPMTLVPEIDFRLDPDTGRLLPIHKEDPEDPDELPDPPILPEFEQPNVSAKEFLKGRPR